jgi:hypothetical protein
MMVMTDGEADIGYVVEDGGRSESDLANQRRAARRSPSERPTDMQDGSRKSSRERSAAPALPRCGCIGRRAAPEAAGGGARTCPCRPLCFRHTER